MSLISSAMEGIFAPFFSLFENFIDVFLGDLTLPEIDFTFPVSPSVRRRVLLSYLCRSSCALSAKQCQQSRSKEHSYRWQAGDIKSQYFLWSMSLLLPFRICFSSPLHDVAFRLSFDIVS